MTRMRFTHPEAVELLKALAAPAARTPARMGAMSPVLPALKAACSRYGLPAPGWLRAVCPTSDTPPRPTSGDVLEKAVGTKSAVKKPLANYTHSAPFKNWFGDWKHDPQGASKVTAPLTGEPQPAHSNTEAPGSPKVVFHGTPHPKAFRAFENAKQDKGAWYGPGHYFTESRQDADDYRDKAADIHLAHGLAEHKRQAHALVDQYAKSDKDSGPKIAPILHSHIDATPDADGSHQHLAHLRQTRKFFSTVGIHGDDHLYHGAGKTYAVHLNIRHPFEMGHTMTQADVTHAHRALTEHGVAVPPARSGSVKQFSLPGDAKKHVVKAGTTHEELYRSLRRHFDAASDGSGAKVTELLKKMGHDGIHLPAKGQGNNHMWVAFHSHQIKSTENAGTFDPKNKDIYKSLHAFALSERKEAVPVKDAPKPSKDAPAPPRSPRTIHDMAHDAYHVNRHLVAAGCNHEEAEPIGLKGHGGLMHAAYHCPRCGRIVLDDSRNHTKLDHSVPMKTLKKAVADGLYKSVHYTKEELSEKQLRWITAHPNGEEPGIPLLVHDNGEQYTVVGGAGGRLNQQVFQKPQGHDEKAAARREKRIEKQKARRAALGDAADDLEQKKQLLHAEAKRQTEELTGRVLSALGPQFAGADALQKVETEARKRALKEKPDASEAEQKEFADEAAKSAAQEARNAAKQVVQRALDSAALRALGDDDTANAGEFQAKIGAAQLVRKFTPEELDSFVQASASIAALKGQARAIARALSTGDQDAIQGINADVRPLSMEEAQAQNLNDYLDKNDVKQHVALIQGSEGASTINQRRNQANGASDGLNSFAAASTGNAILRPDLVKTLGVENAGRVAAAFLTHSGQNGAKVAEGLRERIATGSTASVKAALDKVGEMDKIVQGAKDAADAGDGSVTVAQASITAANMASNKYRLLNTTRGQLRAAAALAHHLEHPSKRALSIPGGSSVVAAHAFAKGLGLKEGDYQVEKSERGDGGGYKVTVQADDLHKLANPHSIAESDRNLAADELRQSVENNFNAYQPSGFQKNELYQKHHEVGIRSITELKHSVLNFGAGSGKTAIIHGAVSHLLSTGKIDKALITMPAKPLAQQADYTDPETGEVKQGEINKFLAPDAAGRVVVCKDSSDVSKALKRIKGGEKLALMMTPDAMRNNAAALKEAGFGGERTAFLADEAHRFAIGQTEGTGSGMAKVANDFAKSEYCSFMSGTLLENNASELWSALNAVHPGQFGSQKAFTEEWQRLSKGQQDFFASESMRGMRDRLSGSMFSYSKPVAGADGKPLTLDSKVVTVKATSAQKAAIARINVEYRKRKASDKPEIAKGASFWRHAQTKKVLNDGAKGEDGQTVNPKMAALSDILASEKARDPKNRVGVYAFNLSTLRAAEKHLGVASTKITGGEDDKATAAGVKKVNDRTNGLGAAYLSNAANYGLNLVGLDNIVKMHALDTPSMQDQLEHRHFRLGQTRNVRTTTILTDHPAEQMAQFRNQSLKKPEMALLQALAADDTHTASILAPRMKEIEAVANA